LILEMLCERRLEDWAAFACSQAALSKSVALGTRNEFAAKRVVEHHKHMGTSSNTSAPYGTAFEPHFVAAPLPVSEPTPPAEIAAALRGVETFDGLTDAEYLWLASNGRERWASEGDVVFKEGEAPTGMFVVLRGEVHVRREKSGSVSFFIARMGQISGILPYSRMKGYGGTGYSVGKLWAFEIDKARFSEMMAAIPSMGQRCVSVLLNRVREVTRMEMQAEKLTALGKLAANLSHELNNPASAAQRTAASLFSELREYGDKKFALGAICVQTDSTARLQGWIDRTREEMADYLRIEPVAEPNPLAASDREATIQSWLERNKVPEAWKIAPTLSETRFPLSYLDDFEREFPGEVLAPAMHTFASSMRVERMAETILGSTVRIFDLISAIKDYSYMDQAPIQDVDLAQSLERTLSMFGSRLGSVQVEMDFDPELPPIDAYGSELNQVWTVLIENALDAMPNGGTLHLQTRLQGRMAVIQVSDSGVGIPHDLQSRIFEPFFTTKAPGKGLGLGLDTAQRIVSKHNGFMRVESAPGRTCFEVRLPLDRAQAY
jgi:signal transduction histidine kinase